ncbi:hypothetical protein [Nocardioides sp. LML1-1-1.1]|uniref:hypothetical protein n=1 Tax=Nocardioides sp. LML1-1-1.1 TaxID=3135248 RepID=UPI00343AD715
MTRALFAGLLLVAALATGCGDDGDAGDDDKKSAATAGGEESAGLPKFCDLLTAEQVTGAVGAPVTLTAAAFDACEIDQEDPRALSGSLGAVAVDNGNGGYDAYRSGSKATLEGAVEHPVDGVGEQAYVTTGTFGGGESLQASGGALVDGNVYTVTLTQSRGMTEDALVEVSRKLLELLVDAA